MRSGRHRRRVYEAVLAQLAQLIQQGQLRPGDRLPAERELAAQLRVSRASLREAPAQPGAARAGAQPPGRRDVYCRHAPGRLAARLCPPE